MSKRTGKKKVTKVILDIFREYLHYYNKYKKIYTGNYIVLMAVGSFHEAYSTEEKGPNLHELSEFLDIQITKKKKSSLLSDLNPYMLGFPSIAKQKYLEKLVRNGYTVVVVDQVTNPPKPKREVTGIYTAGTYINKSFSSDSNNLMHLYIVDEKIAGDKILLAIGMSVIDLSTGESTVHECYSNKTDETIALDEALRFINSFSPKEIIINRVQKNTDHLNKNDILSYLELKSKNFKWYDKIDKYYNRLNYRNEFLGNIFYDTGMLSPIEYIDLARKQYAQISFISILEYARKHDDNIVNFINKPKIFSDVNNLLLGNNAIFQLNVLENKMQESRSTVKSLFDVVNCTSTAVGKRFLKDAIVNPLANKKKLQLRYDCIEKMIDIYKDIEIYLGGIYDIERYHRKIALQMIHPYEFARIIISYDEISEIIKILKKTDKLCEILPKQNILDQFYEFIDECKKLFNINELSKYSNSNDIKTSFFNKNVYTDIDNTQTKIDDTNLLLNNICSILSQYIDDVGKAKLLNAKNKIYLKSNSRDGYYLSLTKHRADSLKESFKVIDHIQISPTYKINVNNFRFKYLAKGNTKIFFDDLKKKSDQLIVLEENMNNLVYEYFMEQLDHFYEKYNNMFLQISQMVAFIDFIKSCAKCAKTHNYSKPIIVDEQKSFIRCKKLRHPIIEIINREIEYIPHNVDLGYNNLDGLLLYGTNSAGKSSLMKAIGLSVIMAQTGMYVPAQSYIISPYHSMYARITANDNLFKGLSSFALEMMELKAILNRANANTLIIGDEICRGTETTSGHAIVAATIIELSRRSTSFIFATHLHDIPKMERIKKLINIKSFHLTVKHDKINDTLIFDRKLKPGSGLPIYGITIAKYIIHDNNFINLTQKIKNEMLNKPKHILNSKKSKYNSELFINECAICKLTVTDTNQSTFDTHHINHQKDCTDGFVDSKNHIKMNSKCNLVVLCKKCHIKVHNDEIQINGYLSTTDGVKLDFKIIKNQRKRRNKKYNNEDIKNIMQYKNTKYTLRKIKSLLKTKYKLNIALGTIRSIWNNDY